MADCARLRCCCPLSSEVCRLTETVSMIFCWISLFGAFLSCFPKSKSAFFTSADFSMRLTSSALWIAGVSSEKGALICFWMSADGKVYGSWSCLMNPCRILPTTLPFHPFLALINKLDRSLAFRQLKTAQFNVWFVKTRDRTTHFSFYLALEYWHRLWEPGRSALEESIW